MNLGFAENPSQRRSRGRQTAGIREVGRMPKDGKNRRSGRDEARGNDLAGALGGDEDYDWIKYLGEGRSPSSSATSAQPPPTSPAQPPPTSPAQPPAASPAQTVARPAARPEPLPQRVRGGGPDRGGRRRRGPPPAGSEEQHTGYGARQSRQGDARPGSGPVTGRAVKSGPARGRPAQGVHGPRSGPAHPPCGGAGLIARARTGVSVGSAHRARRSAPPLIRSTSRPGRSQRPRSGRRSSRRSGAGQPASR